MLSNPKPLVGKHILFFAPAFFNYEKVIRDKMEEMGATTYLYDERSVKGAFPRALNKIVPTWFNQHSHNYFHNIIKKHESERFDFVVVIKSDMMPESTLKEIKSTFRDAKLILYLYDSVADIPGVEKKFKYYDRILTFDREDAINLGIEFRPLFFSDDYIAREKSQDFKYDIAFLGTMHSDRFKIIKKIMQQANEKKWKSYWFLFMQAGFMFYWYWLTKSEYNFIDKKYFSLEKKSGSEIASIVNQTKVIIDIESPGQKGLTMRTIEMIGLKKKLITTNRDIINYDFYDIDNICVVDRKDPIIPNYFIDIPYKEIQDTTYWRYHIDSWILDVLSVSKNV